jgi:hypothetical protein
MYEQLSTASGACAEQSVASCAVVERGREAATGSHNRGNFTLRLSVQGAWCGQTPALAVGLRFREQPLVRCESRSRDAADVREVHAEAQSAPRDDMCSSHAFPVLPSHAQAHATRPGLAQNIYE